MDLINFNINIDKTQMTKTIKETIENEVDQEIIKAEKIINQQFLPKWIAEGTRETETFLDGELQERLGDAYSASETFQGLRKAFNIDMNTGLISKVDIDEIKTIPDIYRLSNALKEINFKYRTFDESDVYAEEDMDYQNELMSEIDVVDEDVSYGRQNQSHSNSLSDIYEICQDIVQNANKKTRIRNSSLTGQIKKRMSSLF